MTSDNSGLQWIKSRLRFKNQRITQAAALVEAARYLNNFYNQPAENLVGKGNDFQEDLLFVGNALAANILRPFATELALKAVYEWENNNAAVKEHKLLNLWKSLSSQSQRRVESLYQRHYHSNANPNKDVVIEAYGKRYVINEFPIVMLLEAFNDAFHKFRYFNEPAIFTSGDQNLHTEKLDFVVQAIWELLSTDTDMIPKIFSIED